MKLFMVFKFTLLEPKKCVENSMEGMHNDVTVKRIKETENTISVFVSNQRKFFHNF